jgi:hypothetical protein
MERESTKHGPARDEELKHETGVEPAEDIPVAERQAPEPDVREAQEIAMRSELARLLTRDEFPAERDTLLARLEDRDASAALISRVAGLSQDRCFTSAHEVMVTLGINAPENRPEGDGV